MADSDDELVLQKRLAEYLTKIPIGVQHGSWNTTRDFKQWVGEAKKAVRSGRHQTLQSLINRYEQF